MFLHFTSQYTAQVDRTKHRAFLLEARRAHEQALALSEDEHADIDAREKLLLKCRALHNLGMVSETAAMGPEWREAHRLYTKALEVAVAAKDFTMQVPRQKRNKIGGREAGR